VTRKRVTRPDPTTSTTVRPKKAVGEAWADVAVRLPSEKATEATSAASPTEPISEPEAAAVLVQVTDRNRRRLGYRRPSVNVPPSVDADCETDASTTEREIQTGTATTTPRKDPESSQDRCWAGPGVVIVADGVGSMADSGAAAQIAVDEVREIVLTNGTPSAPSPASIEAALHHAHQRIITDVGRDAATTALVVSADVDGVNIQWVGNGAVLLAELGKEIGEGQPRLHLTILTPPHVSYEYGRDVLDRILGGRTDPPVDRIWLAPTQRDRLLLVVSDGLLSLEERQIAKAPDGSAWLEISTREQELRALAQDILIWSSNGQLDNTPAGRDLLSLGCQNTLERLLDTGSLHDDATIAAILTPATATDHITRRTPR
jgi:serine/threonine protein phosphatase PrpC